MKKNIISKYTFEDRYVLKISRKLTKSELEQKCYEHYGLVNEITIYKK